MIGSEVEVSHNPHGAGKRQVITRGSRGQDAKPQPGGRTQDLRISGQAKSGFFALFSVLTEPSCKGGLCTYQSDGLLIRIGLSLFAEQCAMGGSAGVSECENDSRLA